jgi:glycosyltransferase involved in cell wall biosynthesis
VLCADTVERLRTRHEVRVLTTEFGGVASADSVLRELEFLPQGKRSTLKAPMAAVRAASLTRDVLASFDPELVFIWNGVALPQAALRVIQESRVPVAFSIAEHWFGRLYASDPFTRYLLPDQRGLRKAWSRAVRPLNRHPALHLNLSLSLPASICWVSEALQHTVPVPPTVTPVVQRVNYTCIADPELWTSVERRPPTDPPTIAFVGRLEWEKGPEVAYRAVAALRDRHGVDARLVMAGRAEPAMRANLDRLADELRLAGRVEILGHLPQPAVVSALAEASAIVVPSLWQEPSGGICLEAALARVPVVASRSGGIPEGLLEEEHALYFPIGDAEACADALFRVLTQEAETAERTKRAFARAQEFDFTRYMALTEEFIAAAVAEHPR